MLCITYLQTLELVNGVFNFKFAKEFLQRGKFSLGRVACRRHAWPADITWVWTFCENFASHERWYFIYRKISHIIRTSAQYARRLFIAVDGTIRVHVYNTHWLLLKSFQWRASGMRHFTEYTPPLIPVSVSFAWVVQLSISLDIMQRVTRCRGWANVAAAGQRIVTRPCYGWSLGALSIALM